MTVSRALSIRSGEGRLVLALAAFFATVETGRGLGEIAADTLFLSRFGAGNLPYMYIVLGLVSLIVAVGYGAGIGRLRRRPFLASVLAGFAVVLVAERLAFLTTAPLVLPVLWLTVYVVGAILLTIVWTVAGTVLDARQAKRLFPICTSAAIVGGFVGTLAAGPLAGLLGTENLILIVAGLLVLAAFLAAEIVGRFGRPAAPRSSRRPIAVELKAGFEDVRRSPLMRLVAVAYLLLAVLLFSVSFPFLGALEEAFPREADLATALGLLSAAVTATSFLVSIGLANRLYARFGVTTAALLLPVVYLVGFGLWLAQFTLATAVAVRFAQQVTQRGVSNAAWTALYNVVPVERRPQVLAFIDGVPGQLGISLSGILLVVIGSLLAPTQIFAMGLVAAIACTWVVLQVRRRYGEALVVALRAGLAEQVLEGGPGVAAMARDPKVISELQRAVESATAGERRLAAELLGRLGDRGSVELLVARLDDPDDAVRAAAIGSLAAVAGPVLLGHFDRLAVDRSPAVRAEAAAALATVGGDARTDAILTELLGGAAPAERIAGLGLAARLGRPGQSPLVAAALTDPEPAIRAAAVRAHASRPDPDDAALAAILAALDDDARAVRRAAAHALWQIPAAVPAIVAVLANGSGRAQEAALIALEAHAGTARDEVRDWALTQVDRAVTLRARASALGRMDAASSGAPGDAADFLRFIVERRGHEIEERLLSALVVLGAPEANGPIRRCLRSDDPDRRAQAVEALEALGDQRLGRAVVGLLDSDRAGRAAPADGALRTLTEDPDPWIRTLAFLALRERLAGEWQSLLERSRADDAPIVQAVLDPDGREGPAMPETDRTLGEIDRMLVLRRVPLFGRLVPEDLQRLAAASSERLYPPAEVLMREGDVGDELFVIVDGGVRVVRGEGADKRLLRTYEAGDHIGELAVLRDQPRAATVVAGDDGVRTLVIGGAGLRAILEERPEAAMAMLATLADRISVQ